MPLYDYQCNHCQRQLEHVFTVDEMPEFVKCTACGAPGLTAKRVIVKGHGGIQLDAGCSWIDDEVRGCLQPGAATGEEKPITTRTEWKNHLKAHPNIDPIG